MSSAVVLATAGYDHRIRFWEASSRKCTRTIRHPDSQVNALAISNDKTLLAAAGNPEIRVFDAVDGNVSDPLSTFTDHTSNVTAVGFQPLGRWMYSGSEDGTVKVWDLRTRKEQRSYSCASPTTGKGRRTSQTSPVNSVVLSPNEIELISGDSSGRVRIWNLVADKCVNELVPFAPEPHVGTGENDNPNQQNSYGTKSTRRRPSPVQSVSIASDGKRIVCGDKNADVFSWEHEDKGDWVLEHIIEAAHNDSSGHTYILKTAISPDAQLLVTTSSDKTAKVWNIERDFVLEKTLAMHQRWVWDACFSADSAYLVTASSDHTARLWDLNTGSAIRCYSGHTLGVTCVCLNDFSALEKKSSY